MWLVWKLSFKKSLWWCLTLILGGVHIPVWLAGWCSYNYLHCIGIFCYKNYVFYYIILNLCIFTWYHLARVILCKRTLCCIWWHFSFNSINDVLSVLLHIASYLKMLPTDMYVSDWVSKFIKTNTCSKATNKMYKSRTVFVHVYAYKIN